MDDSLRALLQATPRFQQRQDSTTDQLRDLAAFASKLGMHDAQDVIRTPLSNGLGDELTQQIELSSVAERQRCIAAVLGERVDAESTDEESDRIYNQALEDAAAAIRALPDQKPI